MHRSTSSSLSAFQRDGFMGNIPCMSGTSLDRGRWRGDPLYALLHSLGNINEEPFMAIWNGDKARAWRKDLRKHGRFPACTRCDMVY
jgi:MoaA/NifB/PqqE/SkfB family radical SAM enzyme